MRRSFSFRSYLPFAIAIVGAAALSLATATFAVQKIEETSWEEIGEALELAGHDWVTVAVDGLQVHLSGTAPDEASRFSALAAAGTVIDATRVIDEMDVVPAKTIEAPEFSIEILRNVDGISLIGLIPAASDRARCREPAGADLAAGCERSSGGGRLSRCPMAGRMWWPSRWTRWSGSRGRKCR